MFADTSGWAHFADRSQTFHSLAVDLIREACDRGDRISTTSWVLSELTAFLTSPMRIPKADQIAFLRTIRSADWVEVIRVDGPLEDSAWQLWQARPDKNWSLVDCTSFVVMQQRKIIGALTSDRHFEQAGFVQRLK